MLPHVQPLRGKEKRTVSDLQTKLGVLTHASWQAHCQRALPPLPSRLQRFPTAPAFPAALHLPPARRRAARCSPPKPTAFPPSARQATAPRSERLAAARHGYLPPRGATAALPPLPC